MAAPRLARLGLAALALAPAARAEESGCDAAAEHQEESSLLSLKEHAPSSQRGAALSGPCVTPFKVISDEHFQNCCFGLVKMTFAGQVNCVPPGNWTPEGYQNMERGACGDECADDPRIALKKGDVCMIKVITSQNPEHNAYTKKQSRYPCESGLSCVAPSMGTVNEPSGGPVGWCQDEAASVLSTKEHAASPRRGGAASAPCVTPFKVISDVHFQNCCSGLTKTTYAGQVTCVPRGKWTPEGYQNMEQDACGDDCAADGRIALEKGSVCMVKVITSQSPQHNAYTKTRNSYPCASGLSCVAPGMGTVNEPSGGPVGWCQ